jgi:hypothetical protein
MGVDESLHDRKAEPAAYRVRRTPPESFGGSGENRRVDAGAVVSDLNARVSGFRAQLDRHLIAGAAMACRVSDEVGEHLMEAVAIRLDRDARRDLRHQRHSRCGERGTVESARLADEFAQVDVAPTHLKRRRVGRGQFGEIVDGTGQAQGVGVDAVKGGGGRFYETVPQLLDLGPHGGQWGSQLVGDICRLLTLAVLCSPDRTGSGVECVGEIGDLPEPVLGD